MSLKSRLEQLEARAGAQPTDKFEPRLVQRWMSSTGELFETEREARGDTLESELFGVLVDEMAGYPMVGDIDAKQVWEIFLQVIAQKPDLIRRVIEYNEEPL